VFHSTRSPGGPAIETPGGARRADGGGVAVAASAVADALMYPQALSEAQNLRQE